MINICRHFLVWLALVPQLRAADPVLPREYAGATPLAWSVRMADSEIHRRGDSLLWTEGGHAKWDYAAGLFTLALLRLDEQVPTPRYVDFAERAIGSFITPAEQIRGYKVTDYNLDNLNPGKTLLALYRRNHDDRYRQAAALLYRQLATQPRTQSGGFWHKQRYPQQMWLDGLYMATPFYAEYAGLFHEPKTAFDDIVRQIRLVDAHTYDPATGLFFHGWDESREQSWADKTTGASPSFWSRSIGWYAMAIVDDLDYLPADHPERPAIIALLRKICAGLARHQDPASGLWYQVTDQGARKGNYLEATASSMLIYTIAKGIHRGYLPAEYLLVVQRGYRGLIERLIKTDEKGAVTLTACCAVAGLGYGRNGTFDYYISEPIVENDLKGVGPFILAGIEMQRLLDAKPIDRHALVTRHNVVLTALDPLASLSVGNGEFAFTVDVTGLQTFPADYQDGIQLGTQTQWGWASAPNPERFTIDDVLSPYDTQGRQVFYADGQRKEERAKKAYAWLRENPHRTQLGRLYLTGITKLSDVKKIRQTLDLWGGKIDSRFEVDGQPVHVETVVHPHRDIVAVRVESERLGVEFARGTGGFATLKRWPTATNVVEVTLAFSVEKIDEASLPGFEAVRSAAAEHWEKFWRTGGAVDLSGSKDPRWPELERRIVLSQYLTAIQCAGSMPPQETGLVQNSWFGKFHLEMHWWHAAHFALWGRPELLERSLGWYTKILPAARALAQRNGHAGARWPKMVGPAGEDSPSPIGGFLIWQQPHPIYYAELIYRASPGKATLEKYRDLVMATAEFMASYAVWDDAAKSFVLGPPLIPAQESYGPMRAKVINPTYELAYWYWGLQTAQQWRERLGLPREPRWDEVSRGLAKPCIRAGRYEAIAVQPFTLTHDHPSLLQAYGFVPPTPLIDPAVMNRTLDFILKEWDWKSTWGWDYPVVAMTAARLGRPEDAVHALLMDTPKNRYLPNGHNYQRPNLPLYLPGNGGLLAAIAMMAAGWDGAPARSAPGFPDNGQWSVRWEGLQPMP